MVTDLRRHATQMPTIPSSEAIKTRIAEIRRELAKLNVLLRTASEMESIEANSEDFGGGSNEQKH
ncbi:MAG: hypothetical protein AAF483_01885 [Planctomycetota bacterium]